MKELWNEDQERIFFTNARKSFATVEQLFYRSETGNLYAYWPKTYKGKKTTLQARNSLIGQFTEKWSSDLINDYFKEKNLYVVQSVICDEIGLTNRSPADIAICETNIINQKPQNIKIIIEVKMSLVWNWELRIINETEKLICIGDYTTHKGNPGLLRSDTMLKAIGKSINIRVSSISASRIPIIILGNTPITDSYYKKVDHLKRSGIIQGFWSLNPKPLEENTKNIKRTNGLGFYRFDEYDELSYKFDELLKEDREFFSSMETKSNLGKIIEIANQEDDYEKKAEIFLSLIRE